MAICICLQSFYLFYSYNHPTTPPGGITREINLFVSKALLNWHGREVPPDQKFFSEFSVTNVYKSCTGPAVVYINIHLFLR